jgi:hypothetical protein
MVAHLSSNKSAYTTLGMLTVILLVYGCNNKPLVIEPISQEYNEQLLTLKGLDTNLFSKKDLVQYYQVDNVTGLPRKEVMDTLIGFANAKYDFKKLDGVNTLNIFFYRKKLLNDYNKKVYESARDTENGLLEGYSVDLIAWIAYHRSQNNQSQIVQGSYYYRNKDQKMVELLDTISLK